MNDKEKVFFDFDLLNKEFGFTESKEMSAYKAKKQTEHNIKIDNERRQNQFQARLDNLKELSYLQDYVGKYADNIPTTQEERRETVRAVLKQLANDTKAGIIPSGQSMSVSKDWLKKANRMIDRIIDYEEMTGKYYSPFGESESDSLQGLLQRNFKSADGSNNKEESILQNQKVMKFINQLECLIYDTRQDYSSTIKTPGQMAKLGVEVEVAKPVSTTKNYEDDDFRKIETVIDKENQGDFRKAKDIHIAVELARQFGIRLDTITQLTVADIKAKKDCINIPRHKNKSDVPYRAVSISGDTQMMLGQIVERALLKSESEDFNNIPIITASKKSLYRSFERLERRAGIAEGKYKYNRFHALRRSFANEYFDDSLNRGMDFNQVKYEVNRALGHNPSELKNLDKYVNPEKLK